jgi:6-phosphogluconate dehydrogenase
MTEQKYKIGMVGLGVMGRNLLLNMADHGYAVAGYDKDESKVKALENEAEHREILAAKAITEFVDSLDKPRAVMMLVPAGAAVDSVIHDLLPHLDKGDLIIDGGNSHFTDTDRRAKEMDQKGLAFLGVGISGGESGARHGPSMMPGGHKEAYERVRPLFEAAAAHVNGDACVTYLGPGSAGHYVKMVHNGIEYGIMQLIAESYDLMKRGLGLKNDELHAVYNSWNQAELNGYLMEITSDIFLQEDDKSNNRLIDMILAQAKQKGTGMWTSQDAMTIQVPVPTIDIAVVMRNMSAYATERNEASKALNGPNINFQGERQAFIGRLKNAMFASVIMTYAQGMSQLHTASTENNYNLDLEAVARIWRGGCIIRSALLEDIRSAFKARQDLPNLLLDKKLGQAVNSRQNDLRFVVRSAADLGIPLPGMMSALGYFDAYRSAWLPANLIQAQRDYFGSHTYERVDEEGVFHTHWEQRQGEPR